MRSSIEQLAASLASIAGLGLTAASWLLSKWLGRFGNAASGESIAGGGADKAARAQGHTGHVWGHDGERQ